jgi:hypothetical protein
LQGFLHFYSLVNFIFQDIHSCGQFICSPFDSGFQFIIQILEFIFDPLEFGDILCNARAADTVSFFIELNFCFLPDPFCLTVNNNTMLDIIGLSAKSGCPFGGDIFSIVRMNTIKECFICNRRANSNAKNPVILIGPD